MLSWFCGPLDAIKSRLTRVYVSADIIYGISVNWNGLKCVLEIELACDNTELDMSKYKLSLLMTSHLVFYSFVAVHSWL